MPITRGASGIPSSDALFYGVFTVKVLAVRSKRMPGWTLPVVGGLLFSLIVGLWLTSALWFFNNTSFPNF